MPADPPGPPPLPAGSPGGATLPCKWKLHITVHSQERFWPKDSFSVVYGPVGAATADPLLPPIPGPWYKQSVTMLKVDSSEVLFQGAGHKDGGVSAMVHSLKKEADWVLVDGIKSTTLLANQYQPQTMDDGQDTKLDLFIRHPLKVYLEFKFKDPEKNVFLFPKDFPIQVWDDKQVLEKKTDEKGRVEFEVDRQHDWITLKFGTSPVYFAVKDAKAGTCDLKVEADRKDLTTKDVKFFGPPQTWGLIESIWNFSEEPKFIDGSAARKDEEGKIYLYKAAGNNWVRRIGEKGAPITLTLDPNWQFNRLEFFDRYYGHTDHSHQRVDAPPILIEAVSTSGKSAVLEGSGQWVLNPTSFKDSVHAVPWIRQKTPDGKKSEKPDKDCHVRFKTDADTFCVSSDANTRKFDTIPVRDKRLDPGVDRLKLYDLPPRWESRKYWTRLGAGAKQAGKFWEDWTQPDLLRSRAAGDPLIFSLDDIIVTDAAFNPVKLAKTDRLAVFYHRFKPAYDQTAKTDVSNHGVIKPNANEPYYSDITLQGADFNYLADYPNWVRLLAGIGCLYDAFDKRTASGVVGARAGVKWFDPVVSGTPPPTVGDPWPTGAVGFQNAVIHRHFILEPYFGQSQHRFWAQFNAGGSRIGRFDMALIRNCDRLDTKELFVSMQYFRLFYNFLTAAMAATLNAATPGLSLKPSALAGGAQTTYIQTSAVGLMDRWNGNDAASKKRGEIVPQDNTKNLTGEVVWFVQPSAGLKDAHFRVDITQGVGRASMGSVDGTGTVDDTYAGGNSGYYGTQNEYILAHELGHGGSLPDEYAERAFYASGGVAGFSCNTPGDPFVDEGLYPDFVKTVYKDANPPFPMMTQTVEMRNRYFWHNAEFARKFIKEPMFAKYGDYPEYKVPGHPSFPRSQYSHWPIADALNHNLGAKGKVDIYLHAAGKERYTVDVIPKGPYDGILSVLLKLVLYETTAAASKVVWVRDAIRNAINDYNKRYYGAGDVTVHIDGGPGAKKDFTYGKTIFRLSPRFLLDPVDKTAANPAFTTPKDFQNYQTAYAAKVTSALNTFGKHFMIHIVDAKAGASGFNAATGKVDLVVDYTNASAANAVNSWTQQYFRDMIGVAFDPKNPNTLAAADLKAIAQAVFTKNGDVKDL